MNETFRSIILRVALPVLPAGLFYLAGFTPFWGGLLFFVVAELVRWVLTLFYRASRGLEPVVQLIGILGAPLPTLAILLLASLPSQGREVQTELIGAATLYVCYIPYAVATLFFLPVLAPARAIEDPAGLERRVAGNSLRQDCVNTPLEGPVTRVSQ